jgi:hypothetical protein
VAAIFSLFRDPAKNDKTGKFRYSSFRSAMPVTASLIDAIRKIVKQDIGFALEAPIRKE